jgi:hypothetical protein
MVSDSKRRLRIQPSMALELIRELQTDPDLQAPDAVFLTIHGLARAAESHVYPSSGLISAWHVRRCTVLGVDAAVRALGVREGMWLSEMLLWTAWLGRWCKWIEGLCEKVNRGVHLTEREAANFGYWSLQREKLGRPRVWPQFGRAAEMVHHSLALPDSDQDRLQTLRHHRLLTKGSPGDIFVGHDGRVRLGHRQMRDSHMKAFGLRRHHNSPEVTELGSEEWDENALDALEALQSADGVRRIRTAIKDRLARAEDGSGGHLALTHMEPLLTGQLTVRQLARDSGRAHSPLARAFDRERAAIRSALPDLGIFFEK